MKCHVLAALCLVAGGSARRRPSPSARPPSEGADTDGAGGQQLARTHGGVPFLKRHAIFDVFVLSISAEEVSVHIKCIYFLIFAFRAFSYPLFSLKNNFIDFLFF